MDEAENISSTLEVATPQAEAAVQETHASNENAPQEDSDWIKNLRRDRKDALRRAEEAERKAKLQEELLQSVLRQQNPFASKQEVQEPDIIEELSREEYVAGEKVAKALKAQQEKFKRDLDEVKQTYATQKQTSLLTELKREYPDFDEVVNSDTLEILETTNPRLAQAIASSNDPYNIAVQSYEYIKAKGLASKQSKRAQEVEQKIEQNKKTVQSPQSFDKRPMAAAFKLTDSMKKELQAEMMQYAQQAGMGY